MIEHPKLQDALVRAGNFNEVSFGYTKEQMISESKRCLQCKKPLCVQGCPVNIDIPGFIKYLVADDAVSALKKIKEKNNLPGVCGRVCPQEDQCEQACVLHKKGTAIKIGYLERYAADYGQTESNPSSAFRLPPSAYKVAVVGAGPAGLTCSADLAMLGYSVTLFESLHLPGGVMTYGIPEFRLPKKIVNDEVENIKSLGVDLKLNNVVGNTVKIDELFKAGYKAVFIGAGAGLPKFMNVSGENLNGVYSANEFLTRVNLMKAYKFPEYKTPVTKGKKVAVIGGGAIAVDSAVSVKKYGAKGVEMFALETLSEMPLTPKERFELIENALLSINK